MTPILASVSTLDFTRSERGRRLGESEGSSREEITEANLTNSSPWSPCLWWRFQYGWRDLGSSPVLRPPLHERHQPVQRADHDGQADEVVRLRLDDSDHRAGIVHERRLVSEDLHAEPVQR